MGSDSSSVRAALGLLDGIPGGEDPGRHPPQGPTSGMTIEQAPAGGRTAASSCTARSPSAHAASAASTAGGAHPARATYRSRSMGCTSPTLSAGRRPSAMRHGHHRPGAETAVPLTSAHGGGSVWMLAPLWAALLDTRLL